MKNLKKVKLEAKAEYESAIAKAETDYRDKLQAIEVVREISNEIRREEKKAIISASP